MTTARALTLLALVLATSCATSPARVDGPARASSGPWLQYADVGQAGFDDQALKAVCDRADVLRSGALMAVFQGRVLLACGDVSRPLEAHSVRKSLVSGLYGTAVIKGEIDIDATLAALGSDDDTPLTPAERSATVRQVIASRSGIYLPAAYAPTSQDRRPARGTHAPGAHWFYNNWDFNVAGVIVERAARDDLYQLFTRRLADPLGMEDWNLRDGFRVFEPTKSRHPAHTFRISARDLARFGQLYLQHGRWADRQLVPAAWVDESTRPATDDGDGTGYGYMWWTYEAKAPFTAKHAVLSQHRFFRALGTGEQGLWVIPGLDLVVVHRADTDHGRGIDGDAHWQLVEMIASARRGAPAPAPRLVALRPTPLRSQLPPASIPEERSVAGLQPADYLGEYRRIAGATALLGRTLTPNLPLRVFLFERRPYLHMPGVGDVQLFPLARDRFAARAVLGLQVAFARASGDRVTTVTLTLGEQTVTASRQ